MGICLGVQKVGLDPSKSWQSSTQGAIKRAFEILWFDTQQKSAHIQFESGAFDAFINEYVVRVYTQEEIKNGIS